MQVGEDWTFPETALPQLLACLSPEEEPTVQVNLAEYLLLAAREQALVLLAGCVCDVGALFNAAPASGASA